MFFLTLMVGAAWSAAPQEIAQGWYLADSGRLQEAAQVAVGILNEHRDDLDAQYLYTFTVKQGLKETIWLEQAYRGWMSRDPGSLYPKAALAGLLIMNNPKPGPWCTEVESLLADSPKDTGTRYWFLRHRYEERLICGGDTAADRTALIELGSVTTSALAYSLKLRLQDHRVDEAIAMDLGNLYAAEPWNLGRPGNLWAAEMKGPSLKQARMDALEAASEALKVESAACAQAALQVFQDADNVSGKVAAIDRRAQLDPGWRAWEGIPGGGQGASISLEEELSAARRKASVDAAALALAELDLRIPPTGPLRATWHKERAFVLIRQGKPDEAFASFKAGWQADPKNASAANAFAYTAALRGQDLELALVVMDSVLQAIPPYDPWTDSLAEGYEGWAERSSNQVAARHDTRGWILYQLGRKEEAVTELVQALLLTRRPEPIIHMHLGFVLHDLGRDDAALRQLGRALVLGPSEEPELDRKARSLAEQLFTDHRWAAGGLDEWLAIRTPSTPAAPDISGQPLPSFTFTVAGASRTIADVPGVRVLVLWSSRSPAFENSLPFWVDLERHYRRQQVQIVSLCVDDRPEVVDSYWEGFRVAPFVLGWAGPEVARVLGVEDQPKVIVVDSKGVIRGSASGAMRLDDTRVIEWVDSLLAGP